MSRIMIIDDQEDIQLTIAATVEVDGHEAISVYDPREAVIQAMSTQPDLVILDIMMPEVSGWDLLRALRSHEITAHKPILMLSSIGDAEARAKGIRLGADDFLQKPFHPEELLARIEALLRRGHNADSTLQGRLKNHSLPEVIQGFQASQMRGRLEVTDLASRGYMDIDGSRLLGAKFEHLEGIEAFLEMLKIPQGEFGFYSERLPEAPETESWQLSRLLLESAWIDDELSARGKLVPEVDARLELLRDPGEAPSALPNLRLGELAGAFSEGRPTLNELHSNLRLAFPRLKLAIAWLIEEDLVRVVPAEPAMAELTAQVDETTIRDVLQLALFAGLSVSPLRVRLLADGSTWPEVSGFLSPIGDLTFDGKKPITFSEQPGVVRLETPAGQVEIVVSRIESVSMGGKDGIVVVWCAPDNLGKARDLLGDLPEHASGLVIGDVPEGEIAFSGWATKEAPRHLPDFFEQLLDVWA